MVDSELVCAVLTPLTTLASQPRLTTVELGLKDGLQLPQLETGCLRARVPLNARRAL